MKTNYILLGLLLLVVRPTHAQSFVKQSNLEARNLTHKTVAMPDGGMVSVWIGTAGIELLRTDSIGNQLYSQRINNDPTWSFLHLSDLTLDLPINQQGMPMPTRILLSAAQMFKGFFFVLEETPGLGFSLLWQYSLPGNSAPTFLARKFASQTYLLSVKEAGVSSVRFFLLDQNGNTIKSLSFQPYLTNGGYTSGAYIHDFQYIGNDSIVYVGAVKLPQFQHEPIIGYLNVAGGYGNGYSSQLYSNITNNGAYDIVLPITTTTGKPGFLVVGHENIIETPTSNNISIRQFHRNIPDQQGLPQARIHSLSTDLLQSNDRSSALIQMGNKMHLGIQTSYGGVLSEVDLTQNSLTNSVSPIQAWNDLAPYAIHFSAVPNGALWFSMEQNTTTARQFTWGKLDGWNPADICFQPSGSNSYQTITNLGQMFLLSEPATSVLNPENFSVLASSDSSSLNCGQLSVASSSSQNNLGTWYPNPAQGERLYFNPAVDMDQVPVEIQLLNAQGQAVWSGQTLPSELVEHGIPTPSSKGMYVIQLTSPKGKTYFPLLRH